jgi:type IV pilus assembly protein PilB
MAKERRHLGEILYKAGLVEKEALVNAIKTSKANNKRLGQVLVEQGLLDEETLTKAIAKQFGLQYINLDEVTIPPDAARIISEDLIKRHNVLPLSMNNGKLKLIISDPLDFDTMDAIRFRLNTELECYVANPKKIRAYIESSFDKTQRKRTTSSNTALTQRPLSLPRPAAIYKQRRSEFKVPTMIVRPPSSGWLI